MAGHIQAASATGLMIVAQRAAQQTVGVFVDALLPRAVAVGKVDLNPGGL